MVPGPWHAVDADLFDAIFGHLEEDKTLLAKARQVSRHWRSLVDSRVAELEPSKRIVEPQLSAVLTRFSGLAVITPSEYAERFRIVDETVSALLVPPDPPLARPGSPFQRNR